MKFKVSETRFSNSNVRKYYVDWEKPVKRGRHWGKRQFEVKKLLRKYWGDHIVLEEFIVPRSGGKSIDFLNLTTWEAVEVDGEAHIGFHDYLHGGSRLNYYNQKLRDHQKEQFCILNEISLIRVYPADPLTKKMLISKGLKI